MSEWISVLEKLPEDKERVLAINISTTGNLMFQGWYHNIIYDCKFSKGLMGLEAIFIMEHRNPSFKPTHWMPIPDLPKKEK
jgi:hypothetical protein